MLCITKRTEYALIALTHLAAVEESGSVRAREIAERYEIPAGLLAKTLQKLAGAGVLMSVSGRSGGYSLARPADEITIGAVLEAVEGSPALMQCMRADAAACDQSMRCTIRHPLASINARVFRMLDAITVSELTGGTSSGSTQIGVTR